MCFYESWKEGLECILKVIPKVCWIRIHESYNFTVNPEWKHTVQNNEDLHLLFVLDGEASYFIDNGTEIPLTRGTMTFISHGVRHYARLNHKKPLQIIELRFGIYTHEGINVTKKYANQFYFSANTINYLLFFEISLKVHSLFHEQNELFSTNLSSVLMYELLFELLRAMKNLNAQTHMDSRIEKAKRYMEEHPFEKIKVDDIAKASGISSRYLQTLFSTEMGISLKEYHMKVQMNEAHSLILDSVLSISVIAQRLGYSDTFTFSKQFKRYFGFSPLYIRKHEKNI